MKPLVVPYPILAAMIQQARDAAPEEACGILSGTAQRACAIHPMTNVDHSPDHFSMAPSEQFSIAKKIRAAQQELLAIYHSHPTSRAYPSAEDVRLAFTPGVTYLILSLEQQDKPVLKGYTIEDGKIHESPVEMCV